MFSREAIELGRNADSRTVVVKWSCMQTEGDPYHPPPPLLLVSAHVNSTRTAFRNRKDSERMQVRWFGIETGRKKGIARVANGNGAAHVTEAIT